MAPENFVTELEEEYEKAANSRDKLYLTCDILQIKNEIDKTKYKLEIYKHIKEAITLYTQCTKSQMYGYDIINFNTLKDFIEIAEQDQRENLWKHLARNLKNEGLTQEYYEAIKHQKKAFIKNSLQNFIHKPLCYKNIKRFFLVPFVASSINLPSLLLALFCCFIAIYISILPLNLSKTIIFKIRYVHYSDSFYLNHGLNVMANLTGISNAMTITPATAQAMILYIVTKIVFIVFISNYIISEINKRTTG